MPTKNLSGAGKSLSQLFDSDVPSLPANKRFTSNDEMKRVRKLWPAGHDAGLERMKAFLSRIDDYAATRSNPAVDSTSRMSPYFAAGVVSVREALNLVKKHNGGSIDFSSSASSPGVVAWVREVVFRELYRQTTLVTPHTAMNLPQNLKFDFVEWNDDEEGWRRWKDRSWMQG